MKNDWKKAKDINTLEVFENYIIKYSNSEYINEAETIIWKKVNKVNSSEAYQNFIKKYPESIYADSAELGIDNILHPLKSKGFPDLELIFDDIGMTCWNVSVSTIAYRVLKPTFISWSDLEQHFNWESEGARQWYPKGENVESAGFSINEEGETVSFGSVCMGYKKIILVSGPTIMKYNGILFLST